MLPEMSTGWISSQDDNVHGHWISHVHGGPVLGYGDAVAAVTYPACTSRNQQGNY
jgi:hypothetical protein